MLIHFHGIYSSCIEKISGENWNKIYIERDTELKDIVEMIKDLQGSGVDVYLNVNNHYEGCVPMTIEKINRLL